MPDVQLNAQAITTTSATTAPASGATETWTVSALASGIPTLRATQTYALVDATPGASTAQQSEIVRVTAATAGATSITVTRGADGTTPVAHAASATFNIVVVASYMANLAKELLPIDRTTIVSTPQPGTWLRINPSSSVTQPLPAGATDGDQFKVEHTGSANVLSYQRSGSDTIEGLTTAQTLQPGEKVLLTYRLSDTTWVRERDVYTPTAGTGARYSPTSTLRGADPIDLQDYGTKNYVDNKNFGTTVSTTAVAVTAANTSVYFGPSRANPANSLQVGDRFKWTYIVTNTAAVQTAGTQLRCGVFGNVNDAVIGGGTLVAGTASVGSARVEVTATVRTIGAAGTAVLLVDTRVINNRGAIGFMGEPVWGAHQVVNATFDTTVAQYLGVSIQSTAANVVTAQECTLEIIRKA